MRFCFYLLVVVVVGFFFHQKGIPSSHAASLPGYIKNAGDHIESHLGGAFTT